jgi:hypothetical protein
MLESLQVLQMNVRKQQMTQQSLINDEQLQSYSVLAIQEPNVWRQNENKIRLPAAHPSWSQVIPTSQSQEQWAIRSMLWIRKDIVFQQIDIDSSDITAATLYLPNRKVLVMSVYIPCNTQIGLRQRLEKIAQGIEHINESFNSTK